LYNEGKSLCVVAIGEAEEVHPVEWHRQGNVGYGKSVQKLSSVVQSVSLQWRRVCMYLQLCVPHSNVRFFHHFLLHSFHHLFLMKKMSTLSVL